MMQQEGAAGEVFVDGGEVSRWRMNGDACIVDG